MRDHLALLDVATNADGAELWIDGQVRATLPLAKPLRVVAGTLELRVRADGFEAVTQVVTLPGRGELKQRVELRPVVTEQPAPGVAPADPAPACIDATIHVPVQPRTEAPAATRPVAAWVLAGTAAAFLVGGASATLVGNANASVYNDDGHCLYGTLTRDQRCGSYRDRFEAANALAVAAYSIGAAAAVASIIAFWMHPKHTSSAQALVCAPGGAAVACGARF